MELALGGLHHLTAITANAPANLAFYTGTLGLRLVKKTVNQDDTTAYHLFYGDGVGSAGSDITFFDWPVGPSRRGTRSITRTAFRIAPESLGWWHDRLKAAGLTVTGIGEQGGRPALAFEDPEGQRLALVGDDPTSAAHPWDRSPVPTEHQIRGLGPIELSVPDLGPTASVLTILMGMRLVREDHDVANPNRVLNIFEMGPGGASAELAVAVEPDLSAGREGSGGVHHVAFRTPDYQGLAAWVERTRSLRVPSSGEVERYYFRSLYFREPSGILFEIATDSPGFAADEPLETLGERLSLPPFLEPKRAAIEANLKPL
jgi:glyoxalase family protein